MFTDRLTMWGKTKFNKKKKKGEMGDKEDIYNEKIICFIFKGRRAFKFHCRSSTNKYRSAKK